MRKIILIIKREYITRVRKRSFVVMSLLAPFLLASIGIIPVWIAGQASDGEKHLAIIDEEHVLKNWFEQHDSVVDQFVFFYNTSSFSKSKMLLDSGMYDGIIKVDKNVESPATFTLFAYDNPSITLVNQVENQLQRVLKDLKIQQLAVKTADLEQINATRVNLKTINLSAEGEESSNAGVATIVGYLSSFIIYASIFFYGAQVMKGVSEEKNSRIVEVVVSSVKPFQLMLGKIFGIGAVGLTQFIIWIVLTLLAYSFFGLFLAATSGEELLNAAQNQNGPIAMQQTDIDPANVQGLEFLSSVNFPLIIGTFLFYFLGGYLLYAALYAAIGSIADDEAETTQFSLPLSAPLIVSIITLSYVLQEPNGTLSVWLSLIPFTAPVTMMMRVPFNVPVIQLVSSMVLLIATFIIITWLASRIYRVGILVYGTKVNYRTLLKWFFQR